MTQLCFNTQVYPLSLPPQHTVLEFTQKDSNFDLEDFLETSRERDVNEEVDRAVSGEEQVTAIVCCSCPPQRILKDLLGTLWLGRVSTPQVGLPY